MSLDNNTEIMDDYDDMEASLDRLEVSESFTRSIRNLADFYMSDEQLSNKGKLLGHYKSRGFLKTYIDVYERALSGRLEGVREKKPEKFEWGYARLSRAVANKGTLYLIMNDEKVYRIKHLKLSEKIAFIINGQKIKTMKGNEYKKR